MSGERMRGGGQVVYSGWLVGDSTKASLCAKAQDFPKEDIQMFGVFLHALVLLCLANCHVCSWVSLCSIFQPEKRGKKRRRGG